LTNFFGSFYYSFKKNYSLKKNWKTIFLLLPLILGISFNLAYHIIQTGVYWNGFYINYLDPVVHIVDLGVLWLLLGSLCIFGIKKVVALFDDKYFLLGLVSFVVLSMLTSFNLLTFYILFRFVLYFSTSWILVSLISNEMVSKKVMSLCMLGGLVGSGLLQSIIAFVQFIERRSLGLTFLGESQIELGGFNSGAIELPIGYFLRAYGTFPHSNVLSAFLIIVLIALFAMLERTIVKETPNKNEFSLKFNEKHILIISFLVMVSFAIFLTWSRIGWLGMVSMYVLWIGRWIYLFKKKLFKSYLIILLTAVLLMVGSIWFIPIPFFQSVKTRLFLHSSFGDVSWQQRIALVKKGVEFVKGNLVLGIGLGNFLVKLSINPLYYSSGIRFVQPIHNIYLLTIVETGLAGTAVLLMIFYRFLILMKKSLKKRMKPQKSSAQKSKYIFSGYVYPSTSVNVFWSLLILLFIGGNFDHYFVTLPQGMAMVLFIFPMLMLSVSSGTK
jgi:O-antigen ligase